MRIITTLSALCILLCLAACQPSEPVCPEGSVTYQDRAIPFEISAVESPAPARETIDINGKPMAFDQVIRGQLCNNHLSGTVYVDCDVVIYEWDTVSNFLDGCDFTVEPGSVIYVASHNNTAYYQGCSSCHQSD